MGGPVSPEVLRDGFRDVFEHAGVGMTFTGLDGNYVRVNRKFADMFGYTVDELCRLGPADLSTATDLAGWLQRQQPLIEGASTEVVCERRYLRKDGAALWVSIVTSLVRDDGGAPLHFLSIVQDVSAR